MFFIFKIMIYNHNLAIYIFHPFLKAKMQDGEISHFWIYPTFSSKSYARINFSPYLIAYNHADKKAPFSPFLWVNTESQFILINLIIYEWT